jgi:hypothetical protein
MSVSDCFIRDIVYDLIDAKLRIKDLELTNCHKLMKELKDKLKDFEDENIRLKEEVTKWKSHIDSYIDDYRDLYVKRDEKVEEVEEVEEVNEIIIPEVKQTEVKQTEAKQITVEENNENKRKARSDYMRDYMKEYQKNKRAKQKDEVKQVVINKK